MKTHHVRNTLAMALTLAAAACPAPHTQAQTFGDFAPQVTFAVGGNPKSVAMGDLNGDGALDLAVANSSSANVSILLGDGAGGFAPQQTFAAGTQPQSVAMGDLNGDGALDLAVTNRSSNGTVSILLGDGAGGFTPPVFFTVLSFPQSIAMVDLNGDGALDLAVVDAGGVCILLGDGAGGFAPRMAVGASGATSVAIGDLNGDGALDLAVAIDSVFGTDGVSILSGNGAGFFSQTAVSTVGVSPRSVAMGDLNGDGALDLAVANSSSANVSVLLGDGAGSFAPQVTFSVGSQSSPQSVVMGDLNGDGALDLATGNAGNNNVSILLGDGAGSFAPQVAFPVGANTQSVAMGDLDGDGSIDLATANFNSHNVSILINQTVVAAPGAFDLLSPPDGSAGLPIPDVTTAWPGGTASQPVTWSTAMGFDTTYTFTLATDPALTNVLFTQAGLLTTTADVPTGVLQIGTRYYWGVTAVNQAGSTPATTGSFTFTTAAPADFNGDGIVNAADLATLLVNWGVLP